MATATLLHAQLKEAVTNGDEQGAKVLLGKLKVSSLLLSLFDVLFTLKLLDGDWDRGT